MYNPLDIFFEKARLLFQRRVQDGQLAYLGDSHLPGARVEIPDKIGYVYARFPDGKDSNGDEKYSTPFPVRAPGTAFVNAPGTGVYVAYGRNNEWQIVEPHYATMDQAGIDTRILNPLHQQSKWVYLWQLTIGLASAVATSTTDSFLITIKKYRHYVNNRFQSLETGDQADKLDAQPYVPATDMHRYVAVWTDTYRNVAELTTSTTQSLFTPLDSTDIQEVVNERPPDAIPHKLIYLSDDQGTVRQQAASDVDVRQFLNTPPIHGFPNPVTYRERIHPDRQVLVAGSLVITASLEVLGSLVGIDTAESDTGGGGTVGMTSFDVAADTGTPATITDGDTASFVGAGGITTDVDDATKTVTIDGGGVVAETFGDQPMNTVYAGPASGADAPPAFRLLDTIDIPDTLRVSLLLNGFLENLIEFIPEGGSGFNINYFQMGNAIAGSSPYIAAVGGSTHIGINFFPKGAGVLNFDGAATINDSGLDRDFRIESDGDANNFFSDGGNNNVGIGTAAPDASAKVEIASTTKGFLLSRMTTTQRNAIGSPAVALIIYNTTTGRFNRLVTGTTWDAFVEETATQTLTGKTIDGDDNTLLDIPLTAIKTVGANTKRFITRDASGVITDATNPPLDNLQHDHTNAANGGQITDAALSAAVGYAKGGTNATTQQGAQNNMSPMTTKGDIATHDGTNTVRQAVGTNEYSPVADSTQTNGLLWKQRLTRGYRGPSGLEIQLPVGGQLIYVTPGMVEVAGTLVEVNRVTALDAANNSDWLDGTAATNAGDFVYIFINPSGQIKMHNKPPRYPRADTASVIATMLVNQAGWNGTAANGLNAGAVIYDSGSGAASVASGDLALIYGSTDTDSSLGRERGSGGGTSRTAVSSAMVNLINTGTSTVTLLTGHNIAINDNDKIAIVSGGPLLYRLESGGSTWWRMIGAMIWSTTFQRGRQDFFTEVTLDETTNPSTTSGTMADIDSDLSIVVFSTGLPWVVGMNGTVNHSGSGQVYFDLNVGGVNYFGDDGIQFASGATSTFGWQRTIRNLLPGTWRIKPQWRRNVAGTATLYAGDGTANVNIHPQFYANEVKR